MIAWIALSRHTLMIRITCGVKNIVFTGTIITAAAAVGDIRAPNIGLTAIEIIVIAVPVAIGTCDRLVCACGGVVGREVIFTAIIELAVAVGPA